MHSSSILLRCHRCALACGAALLVFAAANAATPPESRLEFHSADGSRHSFSELRGHPAVVNFWATWCGPCREEMPRLQKLADSYRTHGVQFIAVSIDAADTQPRIPQVLAKRNFHIPVWTGADENTLKQLGMGELVPATMILDDQGEVVGRIEGEASEKDVRSRVDWLLNGRTGKAPKPVQKNDW